ncbi:site-specific integrase [Mycobacterium sp. OTB74]|uniref:tyrosine-type recombinase/integrase n=1 Tax=Mycobacterium sp. OTB74 TaxID=1853452 RepID=UPI002476B00B|nr:site-specific integrase [Mycobacterium sp. OTB74]
MQSPDPDQPATPVMSWSLHQTRTAIEAADDWMPHREMAASAWKRWRADSAIPGGTPFLLSPEMTYDVALNTFFYSPDMLRARRSTRIGYAGDLKRFLTFLHHNRGGTDWRNAEENDHRAYLVWRREDPDGPRVSDSTWDRELSAVNRFYNWQLRQGNVRVSPIPQRNYRFSGRSGPRTAEPGQTAATYSHGRRRERIQWFAASSYRLWRDVGVRGYDRDGLPDSTFRGRWAARNATFVDLMVRTGMRLAEQASLTTFEIPGADRGGGYRRFWLPEAIAKGRSARWVYVPMSVLRAIAEYVEMDRCSVVDRARAAGAYQQLPESSFVVDGDTGKAWTPGRATRVKVSHLTPIERRVLYVETDLGLEPAALWLSESGDPLSISLWKSMFRDANRRCQRAGVDLHGHAHMLRHTFAVLTLEQMQRGHIASLSNMSPDERGHYTRIFGDPLDWVRCRLGHASVTTTQIYLHALEELEMETRMKLVPDAWDDPRIADPGGQQ